MTLYDEDDKALIMYSTRENGSVGDESASQLDVDEAYRLQKIVKSKFNNVVTNVEVVSEWVNLTISPIKATEYRYLFHKTSPDENWGFTEAFDSFDEMLKKRKTFVKGFNWEKAKKQLDAIIKYPNNTFTGWLQSDKILISKVGSKGNDWGYDFYVSKQKEKNEYAKGGSTYAKGGEMLDWDDMQNDELRNCFIAMYNDLNNSEFAIQDFKIDSTRNLIVYFREEDFSDVEKMKLNRFLGKYTNEKVKPELSRFIKEIKVEGNRVYVYTKENIYVNGGRIDLSELETDNPKLFQCLLLVRVFVANNSTVTDAYVDRNNGNYEVHFKDAHPYFEGLVKPTLLSMTYCEPYIHLEKVEVAKNHIKVPLKDLSTYAEGGEVSDLVFDEQLGGNYYFYYKNKPLMFSPKIEGYMLDKYYVNDKEFATLKLAKEYIDNDLQRERDESYSFASGGRVKYPNLSLEKPMVVNDLIRVPEISLKQTGKIIEFEDMKKITSSKDSERIFRDIWEKDSINGFEQAYVIFLNKSNKPIGYYHHSKGGIDGTIMDIQMISAMAVKSLSKGMIIAHNHPSNNTTPSDADRKVTKQMKQALLLFNIQLLDHIILTEKSYFSFADDGIM